MPTLIDGWLHFGEERVLLATIIRYRLAGPAVALDLGTGISTLVPCPPPAELKAESAALIIDWRDRLQAWETAKDPATRGPRPAEPAGLPDLTGPALELIAALDAHFSRQD